MIRVETQRRLLFGNVVCGNEGMSIGVTCSLSELPARMTFRGYWKEEEISPSQVSVVSLGRSSQSIHSSPITSHDQCS